MSDFKVLPGYEDTFETVLSLGLDALIDKKSKSGVTMQESNMIFQLETHLGRKSVDDLLSRKAAPKTKDVGIESYN